MRTKLICFQKSRRRRTVRNKTFGFVAYYSLAFLTVKNETENVVSTTDVTVVVRIVSFVVVVVSNDVHSVKYIE